MAPRDITRHPGYQRAQEATMQRILVSAYRRYPRAVNPESFIEATLQPGDLLSEPLLGLGALHLPTSEWEAAWGVMRPARWWDLLGRIRFVLAVRRAKAEIRRSLDRVLAHSARPRA